MTLDKNKIGYTGLLARLRPVHRSLISLAAGFLTYLCLPANMALLVKLLIGWSIFAAVYLACCWWVIGTLGIRTIKSIADREDGSKAFVFTMILLASLASFCAVFFIIISEKKLHLSEMLVLSITISGMLLSWLLVHTIFIFHYAHLYYKGDRAKKPLGFPGDENPDYLDFAYFSFVMGCTFQVSDVQITGRIVRRVALFHGLLSFALNTFVIALSINIISGLIH
ncbi:MAG: DUF1345 domain-containing protein [Niabella sp.]